MKTQEWLEQNYLDKKTKSIYLNQPLERILDCSEYENLYEIYISTSVDSSKFEIIKGSYNDGVSGVGETQIIPYLPVQTYLDENYPTQEEREKITKLSI